MSDDPMTLGELILRMMDASPPPGHELRFWRDAQGIPWMSLTYPNGLVKIVQRTGKPLEGAACDAQRPPTIN